MASLGERQQQNTNIPEHHQFIVTGVCTAGKTTFAHELVKKFLVQNICMDPIIEAFEDVFPQLGITHDAPTLAEHIQVCQNFKPFVCRMIDGLDADNFVIEGFRLPLADLHAKYPHLQYFAFGYPSATPRQRLDSCRKFDVDNWTNELSDECLLRDFEFMIQESRRLREICEALNIPFFDTGEEYWGNISSALSSAR